MKRQINRIEDIIEHTTELIQDLESRATTSEKNVKASRDMIKEHQEDIENWKAILIKLTKQGE